MRESSFFKGLPYQFLYVAIAAVVLAMMGPYGTFGALRLDQRLLYWAINMVVGWLISISLAAAIDRSDRLQAWPLAGRMALSGLIAAIPMTGVVWVLEGLFRHRLPPAELPVLFLQVAVLSIVIAVVIGQVVEFKLRSRAGAPDLTAPTARVETVPPMVGAAESAAATQPAAAPLVPPASPALADAFLRRLPVALGRDLLALEMEDHYARVHTALGSTLILMRLRDAVAELGADTGLQVHRSWWVARDAVAQVTRDGGRPVLVLRNGLRVPVSKTHREAVKAMSWSEA